MTGYTILLAPLLSIAVQAAPTPSGPTLATLKQCAPPQAVFDRANNEGQHLIMTGQTSVVGNDGRASVKNLYTSNDGRTKGYHLISNGHGEYCSVESYHRINLLDARDGQVDGRTVLPTGVENTTNSLSGSVKAGSRNGFYPMLQYETDFANSGKVARVTVIGSPVDGGLALAANDAGIVVDVLHFNKVEYTQAGRDMLDRR